MNPRAFLLGLIITLSSCSLVYAQQSKVDSLKPVLAQANDTSRIRLLLQLSNAYLSFSAKKALEPASEARMLAIQYSDIRREAQALLAIGQANSRMGNVSVAIDCFNQAIDLIRQLNSDEEHGELLINVGNAYIDEGIYDQALRVSLDAYKLYERHGNKRGMARALIISGNSYRKTKNSDKATTDYEKALELAREVKDQNLEAGCLNNLSIVAGNKGDHQRALYYLDQARVIHEKSGNQYSLAKVLNNIGSEYYELDSFNLAAEYFLMSLEIRKKLGDKRGQASTLANLGSVSMSQENVDKAIEYYQRSLDLAKEIGALEVQMEVYLSLYEAYNHKEEPEKALDYYISYTKIKDSIFTSDMSESVAEMQARFDVEKAEGEARAQAKQKEIIVISSVIGAVLLLIIIVSIWRQSITRKKVNIELNRQKQEIENKNTELASAYQEIELKNKDITDSIRYARRIQEAILPEVEFASTFGKSGFVFYKPKDIVSGDFYWMERKDNLLLFAAVDCTGHGVPGAFVSIVCSNLLSQSVNEHGLRRPNDILNDVNARLSVTLRQRADESKVRDGMDIALCVLDTRTGLLEYAGAFNPAWVLRKDEIIELKADKFPVGNFEDEELRTYSAQQLQLQKGDRVYIFSDGFTDQFGGPLGKKYKRTRFVDFLRKIQSQPICDHNLLLEKEHMEWRGSLEQIDDILVMGIEFPVQQ